MHCYAYKQNDTQETYFEHVEGIIKCMSSSWEYKALVKKLSIMLGISEKEIESLLRLTAILHDIGKLDEETQKKCISGECTEFKHHYAISARVASFLATKAGLVLEKKREKGLNIIFQDVDHLSVDKDTYAFYILVVFPILLHHYAQITEESLMNAIEKTREIEKLYIHRDCVEVLKRLIDEYLLNNSVDKHSLDEKSVAFEVTFKLKEELEKNNIIKLCVLPIDNIKEIFSYEYSPWKYVIEAVTGLLNMCDGRVAYSHRYERSKDQLAEKAS